MVIRYLLDEHVPHAIAIGLQRRGVEAITLADAKLLGKTDSEIIAYALTQSYVIYTSWPNVPMWKECMASSNICSLLAGKALR